MKIAIITGKDPSFENDTDGASVLVRNVAIGFSKHGYSVDVYTHKGYSGHTYLSSKALLQERLDGAISPDSNGINIYRFPVQQITLSTTPNLGSNFLNRIAVSYAESDFFKDKKLYDYDVIQIIHMAHSFGLIHNDFAPLSKLVIFPMMLGAFYRTFLSVPEEYVALEKLILSEAKHVQTPSQAEMEVLRNSYEVPDSKLFVVNRGFNPDAFKPRLRTKLPSEKPISVICANMIRPQKGQMILVDIVKEAQQRGLFVNVHIAGVDGNSYNSHYNGYAAEFHNKIRMDGLGCHFEFHGVLSQEELNNLMANSDLAIYPSVTETFGKSSLESVVTGLPTILFDDVLAFKEYVSDRVTGFLVPRSPDTVVDLLEELQSNRRLYSSVSKNGIEIAPRFTWEKIINDLLLNYKQRGLL